MVTEGPCWMQFINCPLRGAGLTWQEEGVRVQYHAGNPALLSSLHCAVTSKHQLIPWGEEKLHGHACQHQGTYKVTHSIFILFL